MSGAMDAVAMAVLGLAVGSFLNVCIHRLPRRQSVVRPGSRCPACHRSLRWFENIPILGYLLVRGRCRTCHARISPMYPTVELVTALVFLLELRVVGWTPLLAVRLMFCSAMIVLFVIDLGHRILPNAVTLPGTAFGLLAAVGLPPGWRSALIGVVVGGGGLFLVAEGYYRLRGEEGLGLGDVKMLAMIGAFLGWPLMLATLIAASVLGSVVGIAVLALGLGDSKYELPLGSFLAVAAVAATVVGDQLVGWYASFY